MTFRYMLPALFFALATGGAQAQDLPGDPAAGLEFARGVCAECHYVEKEWGDLYVMDAPDFIEIASQPGYTETALKVFLQTPHKTMPNLILTPKERDDVVSYILLLRAYLKDTGQ